MPSHCGVLLLLLPVKSSCTGFARNPSVDRDGALNDVLSLMPVRNTADDVDDDYEDDDDDEEVVDYDWLPSTVTVTSKAKKKISRGSSPVGYRQIECLINDENSIPCRLDDDNEVFVPFSFVSKYFEVMNKHYGALMNIHRRRRVCFRLARLLFVKWFVS